MTLRLAQPIDGIWLIDSGSGVLRVKPRDVGEGAHGTLLDAGIRVDWPSVRYVSVNDGSVAITFVSFQAALAHLNRGRISLYWQVERIRGGATIDLIARVRRWRGRLVFPPGAWHPAIREELSA
jgi:hypothetical protein